MQTHQTAPPWTVHDPETDAEVGANDLRDGVARALATLQPGMDDLDTALYVLGHDFDGNTRPFVFDVRFPGYGRRVTITVENR